MSEGLNRVFLFGGICADPELRMTSSGQAVLKLRLATDERYKDRTGEWKSRTEYHSVTLWGKRAESLSKFLEKGSKLLVEGSLRTSSYDDRDGNKRYRTEVNATNVILGGGGRGSGGSSRGDSYEDGPATGGAPDDDEIPF